MVFCCWSIFVRSRWIAKKKDLIRQREDLLEAYRRTGTPEQYLTEEQEKIDKIKREIAAKAREHLGKENKKKKIVDTLSSLDEYLGECR
jgi:hypothetical protein